MGREYAHDYTSREGRRPHDQASALTDLLHFDTVNPSGHAVQEAGCGVGAQTIVLPKHSLGALITAVDLSEESLLQAKDRLQAEGFGNVRFEIQIEDDLMDINTFDQGIKDLYRAGEPGGTFSYTFFKGQAVK